jgi:predicted dehydrogenase
MHKVLFIGVGSIGERHLRCFQATGRCAAAICETRDELRRRIAQRYAVELSFSSLEDALRHSFDAALIATPSHLHVPMATTLAQAGIHLFIEKPLATSLEGIARLKAIVAERQLKVAVAYVWRASPVLGAMKEAIQSGRFGRPVQLVSVSGQNFPFYRPAYRETYYRDRATGGGAIQDALTHMFNAGEWLVGPIDWVVADAAHKVLRGVEVEDVVHVLARHGEVLACYSLNQFQGPNEAAMTVHCERGSARFDMICHRWLWATETEGPWHEEKEVQFERDDLFICQASALLDMLEGKRDAACGLDEAVQTLHANLAALESVRAGSVPVPIRSDWTTAS